MYYRIRIERFALIARPIYYLLKKDVEFVWGSQQMRAMDLLKIALTTPPALMPLDYSIEAEFILLAVGSSFSGWGAVLGQLIGKKKRPARYESGL